MNATALIKRFFRGPEQSYFLFGSRGTGKSAPTSGCVLDVLNAPHGYNAQARAVLYKPAQLLSHITMSKLATKITIVMPVLNRAHTIEKAILSVIDQQYENLEFIIIDGGSTDGTVDIIRKYEKYLAYWHSKPDGNPSIAVEIGIKKATGDLIALFMADDWYEPGLFNKIDAAYQASRDAEIITCGGRIVCVDSKTNELRPLLVYSKSNELDLTFYNICFGVSAICCRFIRRSLYERIGLYLLVGQSGKNMLSNDKEFLLRAVIQQAKNVFVPYIGHNYLASKDSSTFGGHYRNIIRLLHEHIEISSLYLSKYQLSPRQKAFMVYWQNDQYTRMVLFKLLERDFRGAGGVFVAQMRERYLTWLPSFVVAGAGIVFKRVRRLVGHALQ